MSPGRNEAAPRSVNVGRDSPASNLGITMDGEQDLVIYPKVILSSTCLTSFPSATLDVTYY